MLHRAAAQNNQAKPGPSKEAKAASVLRRATASPVLGNRANGPGDGIQANGVKAMPNDSKPEHQPPYSPNGLQVYQSHHALEEPMRCSRVFLTIRGTNVSRWDSPEYELQSARNADFAEQADRDAVSVCDDVARDLDRQYAASPDWCDGGVMVGNEVESRGITGIR